MSKKRQKTETTIFFLGNGIWQNGCDKMGGEYPGTIWWDSIMGLHGETSWWENIIGQSGRTKWIDKLAGEYYETVGLD